MPKLEGKVAVVTGGNSGIGLCHRAAIRCRRRVRIHYRTTSGAELDAAVKLIGHDVTGIQGDRLKSRRSRHIVLLGQAAEVAPRHRLRQCGWWRCLRHWAPSPRNSSIRHLNSNVKGVLFTVQKALPLMLAEGGSIILNVLQSSPLKVNAAAVQRIQCDQGRRTIVPARSWTNDLKDRKIRVNAVSPGPIDTPGVRGLAQSPDELQQITAGLVALLCRWVAWARRRRSRMRSCSLARLWMTAALVTGIELFVDGGMAQCEQLRSGGEDLGAARIEGCIPPRPRCLQSGLWVQAFAFSVYTARMPNPKSAPGLPASAPESTATRHAGASSPLSAASQNTSA